MNFNHFLNRIADINLSLDQKKRLFDIIKEIIKENGISEDIISKLNTIERSINQLFEDSAATTKNITSIKQDIIKLKNNQLNNYYISLRDSEFSYIVNDAEIFTIYNSIAKKSHWVITDFELGHPSILDTLQPFIFNIGCDNLDIIINPKFSQKTISSDSDIFKTGDTFTLVNSDGIDSTEYNYNELLEKLHTNKIFSSSVITICDENNIVYKIINRMIFKNVLKK